VTSLYNSADIIFIRWFSGTGAVGFYSAANQLGMPAAMFAGSIQRALLVKSSGLSSKGEAVLSDLENAVSYSGLIGIPLLFGALAMPNALMVTVFGGDFSGAGTALIGLSIFHVLDAYKKAFDAVLSGTDRPQLTFRTNLIVACVHVVVAVVLGSRYGLLGVIAATVAAEALRLTQYQLYARQYFDGFVLPRPVLEQVASAMAMYVAVEAVLLRVAITGWVPLVAVVGLGVVVYFVALLGLSSHFRHTLYVTLWPVVADRFD
jgi:O-antigen/teichoic acid export membrane protein